MKRVYKCEYCYLKNARPCYECSACMSGDDHFRPAKPEKKRTTNADRIRAMTDDELNDLFHDIYDSGAYDAVSYGCGHQTNSFEWTMDWLKQPAEGE